MTTLPANFSPPVVIDVHPKLTHELHRAIEERSKARDRGDWVTSSGYRLVIEALVRISNGERT